jgi:hypothetical protein
VSTLSFSLRTFGSSHWASSGRAIIMKLSPLQLLAVLVVLTAIQSFMHPLSLDGSSSSSLFWDPYPSPGALPHQLVNRTMIFVHVGKTGGETIKWRLQAVCNLRGSQRKKARCHEQFTRGESKLSHATIGYTHCGSQRPKNSMAAATTFIFSIRDPIVSTAVMQSATQL